MKKSITTKELIEILKKIPTEKIEEECNAWGCCQTHYREVITTNQVIFAVEEYLKSKPPNKPTEEMKKYL